MAGKDVCLTVAKVLGAILALVLSPILVPALVILMVFSSRCCPFRFVRYAVTKIPGASWQQGDIPPEKLQESHKSAPQVEKLPDIGELISYKYRCASAGSARAANGKRTLKLLQWNFFLGQNLDALIAECKKKQTAEDLDMIVLSEDNIFRSASAEQAGEYAFHSTGAAIAKAVGMDYIFVPMYYRKDERGQRSGCYGASILSRHPLQRPAAIKAAEQPAVVLEALGAQGIEGCRYFPYAELEIEGLPRFGIASVHLPSCGELRELLAQFEALCDELRQKPVDAMIIAGDMNIFDFKMRYIPITGRKDIVFSCKTEQAEFRRVAQQKSFEDPFRDSDCTHQSLPGKLDWTLASPALAFRRHEIEPRTRAKAEWPSDHLYSLTELEATQGGCSQIELPVLGAHG